MVLSSPHQSLSMHIREASWELNKWHPRELFDHNHPPPVSEPLDGKEAKLADAQWHTAILPCGESNFEQLVYCHLDRRPQGLWVLDITDTKNIQRLYPTTTSMIYTTKDISILKPSFLIIHMFRDTTKDQVEIPLPKICVAGHIDPEKFNSVMQTEARKISTDLNSMLDAIHEKVVNGSEP